MKVDHQPMLVSADVDWPVPAGWRADEAGNWQGRPVVAVYDPARHDVLIARDVPTGQQWRTFRDAGFELQGVDGTDEFWVRDRLAVTRDRLARLDDAAARGREVLMSPKPSGLGR